MLIICIIMMMIGIIHSNDTYAIDFEHEIINLKIELYIQDKGIFQYIMMDLHTMHRHGKSHIQKIKSIGGMQSPIVITNFWTV